MSTETKAKIPKWVRDAAIDPRQRTIYAFLSQETSLQPPPNSTQKPGQRTIYAFLSQETSLQPPPNSTQKPGQRLSFRDDDPLTAGPSGTKRRPPDSSIKLSPLPPAKRSKSYSSPYSNSRNNPIILDDETQDLRTTLGAKNKPILLDQKADTTASITPGRRPMLPRTIKEHVSYSEISIEDDECSTAEDDEHSTAEDEADSDLYHDSMYSGTDTNSDIGDISDIDVYLSDSSDRDGVSNNMTEISTIKHANAKRDINQAPRTTSHSKSEEEEVISRPRKSSTQSNAGTVTTHGFCSIMGKPEDLIKIPTHELFDVTATSEKIVEDIETIAPLLSPNHPLIKRFIRRIQKQPFLPHITPKKEKSPTTWTKTDPYMDQWWTKAVNEEPRPRGAPEWLPTDQSARVKPTGNLDSPLMVVTGFPLLSKIHPLYATVDDISQTTIWDLYGKLGYHTVESASTNVSMLHIDTLPIQIDRKLAPRHQPLQATPASIIAYWHRVNECLFKNTRSKVILLLGLVAQDSYIQSLKSRGVRCRKIFGTHDRSATRPIAILELDSSDEIQRIAVLAPHPEIFRRRRSSTIGPLQRKCAIYERLIDTAMIILGNKTIRPCFLMSHEFYRQHLVGLALHVSEFLGTDDEVATALCRPTGRNYHFRLFLARVPQTKDLLERISKISIANGLNMRDSAAYWRDDAQVAIHGPHALTHEVMAIKAYAGVNDKNAKHAISRNIKRRTEEYKARHRTTEFKEKRRRKAHENGVHARRLLSGKEYYAARLR
ncbi:hypothetical protein HRS9139_04060 [Pyrenophora teres f. teres]|uniref:Uncharacterized protein n=1 Tax=Pyrenophora teres f. teres TaxID=97479 RepID=A0A6S6V9V3_9PLEO|nr:hypothetical protein HRS9139_04060 [Pyrenophora teres f. teres]CAE6998992.1 hypothetical protein PTTW11_00820 [Pyrenophora teres f. teres]